MFGQNCAKYKQPLPAPPEGDISLPYDITNMQNYSLAVSGDVFRWIVDYAPADLLSKVRPLTFRLITKWSDNYQDARERQSFRQDVTR